MSSIIWRVTRYSENGLDLGAARDRSRDTALEEIVAPDKTYVNDRYRPLPALLLGFIE